MLRLEYRFIAESRTQDVHHERLWGDAKRIGLCYAERRRFDAQIEVAATMSLEPRRDASQFVRQPRQRSLGHRAVQFDPRRRSRHAAILPTQAERFPTD